jgi:Lrp/AsnC family transcriptional regulator for asnA, asnC and gidA
MIARDHEHMRKLLYEKIDTIQGIAKTDSMIELAVPLKYFIVIFLF